MILESVPAGEYDPYAFVDDLLMRQPETSSLMPDYVSPIEEALREKENRG